MQTHKTSPLAATINSVDVGALAKTIDAIKHEPALSAFQFRARNTWLGGGLNRSTIQDYSGAGQEQTRTKSFHPQCRRTSGAAR